MTIGNYVFLGIGIIVILVGLAALLNPNWSRRINLPGGPRLKSIGAMITGIILIIIGLVIEIPME